MTQEAPMKNERLGSDEITVYIEDKEYIANTYVMRCFFVMMVVYTICFFMNLFGIFVIEKSLMLKAYIPSILIYLVMFVVTKRVSLSCQNIKYFILLAVITVITLTGVFVTYHVALIPLLPILYATLYSSKGVLRYVYFLTVPSTIVIVYGGFYFGLCDANMVLLTADVLRKYTQGGTFLLTQVNPNPNISLMLYFVIPRCLIYIAFVSVCSSVFKIVNGSLEKVKLIAELEKAKEEAERANQAKSQFLAKVSHEIRTPVNAVLGINEMILRESKESEIRAYARDVKNSSITLLNIVNEILDSSKIESGKMELVEGNYEIGSMLNDLYNMIHVRAKDKELQLVFDIDPELPNEYYGDEKCIRQVLLNLLTNAVKYTNRGNVTLKVRGRREGEQEILRYEVIDTGIGIKQEDIGKLTEAFRRLDVSRNRGVEGTGLGISIVQQFLQMLGSELQVQSEYEKGSAFSFELTQQIVNAEPVGNLRERIRQASEQEEYRTEFYAPEARVLVVDDYKMNLKVFKGLLKQTKMQIFEAESGKECLEFLETQSVDIVFLDHMMPEMDGIETLHEIKRRHLCDRIPVIMLTANAILGDREKYLQEGFDDFLSKPIISSRLDQMLLQHLPERLVMQKEETKEVVATSETIVQKTEVVLKDESEKAKKEKEMGALERLKELLSEIDFKVVGTFCGGDGEFYVELFEDFTKLPIKEELARYLEEGDFTDYCIRIHGFKNNAYSIGAMSLGDLAYEMEKMTRECIPEGIPKLQNQLFEQYDTICAKYDKAINGEA